MSATLASEDQFLQASTALDTVSPSAETDHFAAAKPGLLARILEAIGKSYYVTTPDGEGFYILPFV